MIEIYDNGVNYVIESLAEFKKQWHEMKQYKDIQDINKLEQEINQNITKCQIFMKDGEEMIKYIPF